uniref:hypothetical protein n=1 Tax=Amycolatopsis sp. CA-151526 TaxID=3239921 RepID=UPI003F491DC5
MGNEYEVRDQVAATVAGLFDDGEVVEEIVEAEAFGALVYRVGERMRVTGQTAAAVLGEVDEDDLRFTGRADDPARFLTAKVRDLPEPAGGGDLASRDGGQAVTSGNVPAEVTVVIDAAAGFTGAVERAGFEEFASAAASLAPAQLAWTLDRLDDVRQSLLTALECLGPAVAQRGADAGTWDTALGDLSGAGDGLFAVLQAIDPGAARHAIPGQL